MTEPNFLPLYLNNPPTLDPQVVEQAQAIRRLLLVSPEVKAAKDEQRHRGQTEEWFLERAIVHLAGSLDATRAAYQRHLERCGGSGPTTA